MINKKKLILFISAFLFPVSVYADDAGNREWLSLLHYQDGRSLVDRESDFFFAKDGFKNPEGELNATIEAFFAKKPLDDKHAICRFPARFEYVLKHTDYKRSDFVKPDCLEYRIFETMAPIDDVRIVFAAENNRVASTAMGHIFLKISGTFNKKKREHAFSYFAHEEDEKSLKFYWNALVGNVNGIYVLSPYKDKKKTYLAAEKRIIWEIGLKLTEVQKQTLRRHMWELKNQNVQYAFISHNCGTGLMNLLKAVYPDMNLDADKIIDTPIDYITRFRDEGYIDEVSFEKEGFIEKPDRVDLRKAKKSSRIYAGYRHFGDDFAEVSVQPLYQDFFDVNNAQVDDLGTKIMAFNLLYNGDDVYLNKLNIFEAKSIIGNDFGNYFKLSLESDLGDENSSIKPVGEFGISYALSFMDDRVKPYILPKAGYRYNRENNFYAVPEIGMVLKPSDEAKAVLSYEKYFDSRDNNRGFGERFAASFAYELSENLSLFATYHKYSDVSFDSDKEFTLGLSRSY